MNIINIINKKRLKEALNDEEIKYVIDGFLSGEIKDYQMSSLLMAILLNDMTNEEIFSLTKYMAESGDMLDLTSLGDNVVDKHSTGGVGDKTTIIIAPIVSACGAKVAKMSGRGLGHTGGTIDKLESIPGFVVNLTEEDFINQVANIGLAITSQTENVALADKKIYALRDVTGTVASIPLIATSIMSKKIAGGADKILLDVKVGDGALMKNMHDAQDLADLMEEIGKFYHREVVCELTDMNTPLGDNIGNSLEVIEAMDILNGKKGHLRDLCVEVSSKMVSMSKEISVEEAEKEVLEVLNNGKAFQKFLEFVKAQGGDINSLEVSTKTIDVKSTKKGTLKKIKALKLGELSLMLGAGRINKEDVIDHRVGIVLKKHLNNKIDVNDILCTLYVKDLNIEINPGDYFEII